MGTAPAAASAAPPTVAVHPAFIVARPQTTRLNFLITMSSTSTSAVTVGYHTVNGTALAGSNYQAETGTATIAAGAKSVNVLVPVNPVPISPSGATKAMSLDLSGANGATLGTSSATGTIYPDPYTAKHSGSLNDVVIDPTSAHAYITNSTLNEVEVLNIHTGRYSAPVLVGSDPTSIDISPDGKTLYVCDSGGQTISVIDVATHKVIRTIITPQGFDAEKPFSIAIGNA